MKKIILIVLLLSLELFAGKVNSNKLIGFWIGEVNDMRVSLSIFQYTGGHSYAYEFNANIGMLPRRGYIKEDLGNGIFKMNINGEHAVWHFILTDKKISIYQSGNGMLFPTIEEVILNKVR